MRRTQAERRETTIRKILDAAIDTLIEHGYAGASTQLVATRAGVSAGGLFRHFPTREALMVAVAEDVSRQLLERYAQSFASLEKTEDPIVLALRLLRDATRSRLNQVWYELVNACRTSPALRTALAPLGKRYMESIAGLARTLLPELAESLGDQFPLLVTTVVAIFDGEQMHRTVHPTPELEGARIEALALVAQYFLTRAREGASPR